LFVIHAIYSNNYNAGIARERKVEGDLLVGDMGQGLPFRPGSFDAAIRCANKQPMNNEIQLFT
jgi:hypothetical protein